MNSLNSRHLRRTAGIVLLVAMLSTTHTKKRRRWRNLVGLLAMNILLCLSASANTGRYLIVHHSALSGPALNDLVSFEEDRGFEVITHSITDGVSNDSVKTIIANQYHQHYLRYVLLVGTSRWFGDTAQCDDCYANASEGQPDSHLLPLRQLW